jgi:hypothetical protein
MTSLPDNTVENMVLSGGLSCLVSLVFNNGHPLTMGAIGALAALTHACATTILKQMGFDDRSLTQKTGLPIQITKSLIVAGSVALTQVIVTCLGGPGFSVARTAIVAVGLTLLSHSGGIRTRNFAFIALA